MPSDVNEVMWRNGWKSMLLDWNQSCKLWNNRQVGEQGWVIKIIRRGFVCCFSRMRILMMEHVMIKWSQQWVIMMKRKCWAGGHGVVWRAWWDQAGVFTSGARQASRVIMLSRCVIKRYMVLLCYHQLYVIFCHAIWYVVIIIVCQHGNHLRHFSCS